MTPENRSQFYQFFWLLVICSSMAVGYVIKPDCDCPTDERIKQPHEIERGTINPTDPNRPILIKEDC